MSPGFCALPPGIFSVEGTTQTTLTLGLSAARARIAPSMVAPPAMSYFIFSIPSAGLIEMPPVSKVTAFPTKPITGAPGFALAGVYVMTMTRGGSTLPCATLKRAPIFKSAIFRSSRISTARPASLAIASARSARICGVSLFEGSLTRSRVKFCDSAMTFPMVKPFSPDDFSESE